MSIKSQTIPHFNTLVSFITHFLKPKNNEKYSMYCSRKTLKQSTIHKGL